MLLPARVRASYRGRGDSGQKETLVPCMETSEQVAWRTLCTGDQRVELNQGPTQDTIRDCTEWETLGRGPR